MSSTIELSSGAKIPALGFGTWKIELNQTANAVKHALKAGYRHIDCASDYGNEHEVGTGILAGLSEYGIKREDVWVTSKLWNTNHAKEHVRQACERTLSDLKLSHLDLYLIHFPIAMQYVPPSQTYPAGVPKDAQGNSLLANVSLRETWEAMEALVDAGLVKNIGVSNFNAQLIYDLLTYARIRPVVNQIEVHPYFTQDRIVNFCRSKGIHVTAYSPFASLSYIPFGTEAAVNTQSLLEHDVVKAVAAKHSKTSAQVLLKWGVQRGLSVVPKASSPSRIEENIQIFDFSLSEEDILALNGLNKNLRFNDVSPPFVWGTDIYA